MSICLRLRPPSHLFQATLGMASRFGYLDSRSSVTLSSISTVNPFISQHSTESHRYPPHWETALPEGILINNTKWRWWGSPFIKQRQVPSRALALTEQPHGPRAALGTSERTRDIAPKPLRLPPVIYSYNEETMRRSSLPFPLGQAFVDINKIKCISFFLC